jgi:hypothetical protein
MRAALARGEYGVIDASLQVLGLLNVLAEEDETGAGSTERLVCRGGHDMAMLERTCERATSNETGGVRNVRHEERAVLIRDLAELGVVPVTRVRRRAANDQPRLVDLGLLGQLWAAI